MSEGPNVFVAWTRVLAVDYQQTQVGRQLEKCGDQVEQSTVIRYTFAGRSTLTLVMRLGPLVKYLVWRASGDHAWPPGEDDLYSSMKFHCPGDRALSRAMVVIKGFRFLYFVCRGSRSLGEAVESPFLQGMAFEH